MFGRKQVFGLITMAFAFAMASCPNAFSQTKPSAQRPNLSGVWEIDPSKSVDEDVLFQVPAQQQPKVGKRLETSTVLRIVHVDPELRLSVRTISRGYDSRGLLLSKSEREDDAILLFTDHRKQSAKSLDGRKVITRTEWRGSSLQSTSSLVGTRTTISPTGLVTPFHISYEDMTLSVSEDGKDLTIETATRGPGDTRPRGKRKRVYRRMDSSSEAARN